MPPVDFQAVILTRSVQLLEYWGSILRFGSPAAILRSGTPMGDKWRWLRYDDPTTTAYELRHMGLIYEPSQWLNDRRPTPTERQGFSRAMRQLAAEGLIKPIRGNRTRHFTLTPRGLEIAVKLAQADGEGLDVPAVAIALTHTKWATDEHLQAVAEFQGAKEPTT